MEREEVLHLTRAMANSGERIDWHEPLVADKHCIGGIPGNRTSMLVVPIVAAHGMFIPKTSSRAITSPAGTADTMEVLAAVELPPEPEAPPPERSEASLALSVHYQRLQNDLLSQGLMRGDEHGFERHVFGGGRLAHEVGGEAQLEGLVEAGDEGLEADLAKAFVAKAQSLLVGTDDVDFQRQVPVAKDKIIKMLLGQLALGILHEPLFFLPEEGHIFVP